VATQKPAKKNAAKPLVGILMGSRSDWELMLHAAATLETLDIPHEVNAISAHRAPDRLGQYCETARDRGLKVLIAGAGLAAALPGVAAAKTSLPVLGVPIPSAALGGMDALLSMVQMPPGIPVGTLAIGKAGAINAALLAAAILALSDEKIRAALEKYRSKQTATVLENTDPRS
jgi:5-(carboxyamino)imidazole ribonucleotide mutase